MAQAKTTHCSYVSVKAQQSWMGRTLPHRVFNGTNASRVEAARASSKLPLGAAQRTAVMDVYVQSERQLLPQLFSCAAYSCFASLHGRSWEWHQQGCPGPRLQQFSQTWASRVRGIGRYALLKRSGSKICKWLDVLFEGDVIFLQSIVDSIVEPLHGCFLRTTGQHHSRG